MIYLIFKEKDDRVERCSGFAKTSYSSNSDSEIIKKTFESELNKLIPDGFEETDWKDVRGHYKLDDSGNIVFDEGYEPETEEQ